MSKDKLVFDEDKHEYKLGDKVLISVTQLLKKHGLTKGFAGIDEEVLNAKAERGRLVHKALEEYIKTGDKPLYDMYEVDAFEKYLDTVEFRLDDIFTEIKCNNNIVAGTIDMIVPDLGHIVDFKTSATLDYDACRWQLSLYSYLVWGREKELPLYEESKLEILHFKDNELKVIPFKPIDKQEIEELLDCERKGEIYKPKGLVVSEQLLSEVTRLESEIKEVENTKKALDEQYKAYKQELYNAMQEQGIKSWETADKSMLITVTQPYQKTTIDSDKLRAEQPEIAKKYEKVSNVKGSLKITLRSE